MRGFKSRYAELITSVSHLALLAIAFQLGKQPVTAVFVALIGLISFFAWASGYRRMRLIADTPTSRIGSAAQGYVELHGRAVLDADNLIRSPISGISCIWYRFWVYSRQENNKWVQVNQGISNSVFEITDGTGSCFIDPDHAEVIGAERRVTRQGDFKNVEELLYAHSVYALGEFGTLGGAGMPLSLNEDVALLLAEWKRDKKTLHERFDLDGNGEIDMQEWELARRATIREVEKQHREIRTQNGTHVMRAPHDGRLFILSNHSPHQLRNKYLGWSMLHMSIVVVSVVATIWLLS
ncbi:MAG: hypothetical protein CVU35_02035 [Betaproteobacteria bacterium HGW-Betaproteobacteria-8]|nr:MAG: hypothetical protein CVU35_02035 [Betaproteobacteria bacterium HGW-Betaproteobacteria-8]